MNGFTFTLLLIIFVIWLQYELRKSSGKMSSESEEFWEKENKANQTRKKSIEHLDYIRLDMNRIPRLADKTDDSSILELSNKLTALSDKRILNLTGITNTELKTQYGAANITALSEFDANYTSLVNTIARLGERLMKLSLIDEAVTLLEYGVDLGTDVSSNYYLLADHYLNAGKTDKAAELIKKAKKLNTINRQAIISNLERRINTTVI